MASKGAGIKMEMQKNNRMNKQVPASILFVLAFFLVSLSLVPLAIHAQQPARGAAGAAPQGGRGGVATPGPGTPVIGQGQNPAGRGGPAGPIKFRPDGKPDISGIYNSPDAGGAAWNIEPGPPQVAQPATTGAISDTPDKLVPYTAAAKAKRDDLMAHHLYDDPEAHCLQSGIPRQTYAPFGWQILQPDGYVVMIYEAFHAYRILPLDGRPHLSKDVKLWEGDGRAHWEGNTLVVETTNQTGKTWLDMSGNFTTANLTVVERFTPIDANTLQWDATMTDPTIYTRPWTISARISKNTRPNNQILEFACHEGEADLIHYTKEEGNAGGSNTKVK